MCKLADKVSPASERSPAHVIPSSKQRRRSHRLHHRRCRLHESSCRKRRDIIGKKTLLGAGGAAATAILVQAALDGVAEINVFNVRDNFFGAEESLQNSMSVLPAGLPCTTSPIRKSFAHPSQTAPFLSTELPSEWLQKPRTPSSPTQRCSTKTSSFSM